MVAFYTLEILVFFLSITSNFSVINRFQCTFNHFFKLVRTRSSVNHTRKIKFSLRKKNALNWIVFAQKMEFCFYSNSKWFYFPQEKLSGCNKRKNSKRKIGKFIQMQRIKRYPNTKTHFVETNFLWFFYLFGILLIFEIMNIEHSKESQLTEQ